MLCGLGQRTAVAVALMGVLLLSVGTCVLPAQRAAHSCCQHMGMPCVPAKASCCTASPQAPVAVITTTLSGSAQMAIVQVSLQAGDNSVTGMFMSAAALPSQSPPPGIFNLRL